jgi:hypothetical protein
MAKTAGIQIEGIAEAVTALRKVGDALAPQRIQDCLLVGAEIIKQRARALVRVGPGVDTQGNPRAHLRDAIFSVKGKLDPAAPSVIAGVSGKRMPHAHLVEFEHVLWKMGKRALGKGYQVGTVPEHPFLRPALDQSKQDIPALVGDMIKRTLESFGIDVS